MMKVAPCAYCVVKNQVVVGCNAGSHISKDLVHEFGDITYKRVGQKPMIGIKESKEP